MAFKWRVWRLYFKKMQAYGGGQINSYYNKINMKIFCIGLRHTAVFGWFILKVLQFKANKHCSTVERQSALYTLGCLKSLFTVAKPLLHLYRSSDNRPQTKGETTSPSFCSLVCRYCPVCKKIKLQSLRYIHHLTFLACAGSMRRVCGDLEEIFWSSAYSVLKRHQEKLHWFFFLFWLLQNFCTES